MQKTTTINLSGQVFVIDNDAYKLLQTYLDDLRAQLKNDVDRDEVLQDFETAIAEHFMSKLGKNRRVVTAKIVESVTATIGRYEPEVDENDKANTSDESGAAGWQSHLKRPLQLNKDDAMIAGVCSGIARTLGIDSFWVRALFVVLLFATSGFMIVVYIILSFIMVDPDTQPVGFWPNGRPLDAAALVANSRQRFLDAKMTLARQPWRERCTPLMRVFSLAARIFVGLSSGLLIVGVTLAYVVGIMTWQAHRTSPNQPLFATAGGVNLALIASTYLLLVLPLLILFLAAVVRRAGRRKLDISVVLMLFGSWLIALVVSAGAATVAIPKWANWSQQHPKNSYFQLNIQHGHVDNFCLNAGGHCNDQPVPQPLPYKCMPDCLPPQPVPAPVSPLVQ